MAVMSWLLLMALMGVSMATECGILQRLKVKQLWAAAYQSGEARIHFARTVWNVFLAENPDYRKLFNAVGVDDTRSPQFKAHSMRVLGGVDAIISVLENDDQLNQIILHYAIFHNSYGELPFREFGHALDVVLPSVVRRRIDHDVWNACFETIARAMSATGARQSPIDLVSSVVHEDKALLDSPWIIEYVPEHTQKVVNTGHSVKVAIDYHGSKLSGGPLGGKSFCLEQFHFHWGSRNDRGSEHTVDGSAYPAELHLVHWNCERYDSFMEAVPSEDGLAVLGVFIQVGDDSNPALKTVTDQFDSIHYKHQFVELHPLDPSALLPSDRNSYWTYAGSLTTPPYSETVTWTVFKDPITMTQAQLEAFRHLMTQAEGETEGHHGGDHHSGPLVDNYRKTQPLLGRALRATFN